MPTNKPVTIELIKREISISQPLQRKKGEYIG
jgi:hypothetical protein